MSSPIIRIVNLIKYSDISNRIILRFAFAQVKTVGFTKMLSMLLGALMVGVSSIIKIPQIKKIVDPPTVEQREYLAKGVPQSSVQLETLTQLIHVTYNQRLHLPFIFYGESLLLGIQNVVLLLVLEFYRLRRENPDVSLTEEEKFATATRALVKPFTAIVAVAVVVNKLLPFSIVLMLEVLCIPISIAAKISQIQRNKELQSTAHLSLITICANLAGSVIRVFTTVSNLKKGRIPDLVLLGGYTTSFVLNTVLMGQIIKCYKQDYNRKD